MLALYFLLVFIIIIIIVIVCKKIGSGRDDDDLIAFERYYRECLDYYDKYKDSITLTELIKIYDETKNMRIKTIYRSNISQIKTHINLIEMYIKELSNNEDTGAEVSQYKHILRQQLEQHDNYAIVLEKCNVTIYGIYAKNIYDHILELNKCIKKQMEETFTSAQILNYKDNVKGMERISEHHFVSDGIQMTPLKDYDYQANIDKFIYDKQSIDEINHIAQLNIPNTYIVVCLDAFMLVVLDEGEFCYFTNIIYGKTINNNDYLIGQKLTNNTYIRDDRLIAVTKKIYSFASKCVLILTSDIDASYFLNTDVKYNQLTKKPIISFKHRNCDFIVTKNMLNVAFACFFGHNIARIGHIGSDVPFGINKALQHFYTELPPLLIEYKGVYWYDEDIILKDIRLEYICKIDYNNPLVVYSIDDLKYL
jgi:hypothetical protein